MLTANQVNKFLKSHLPHKHKVIKKLVADNKVLSNNRIQAHNLSFEDKSINLIDDYFNKYMEMKQKNHSLYNQVEREYLEKYTSNEGNSHIKECKIESLKVWLDHLSSPEMSNTPTWMKYYIWQQITNAEQTVDKSNNVVLSKRDKNSSKFFPELNKKALKDFVELVTQYLNNGNVDEDKKSLFKDTFVSFNKIYTHFFNIALKDQEGEDPMDGEWRTFPQGSSASELVESFAGQGTNLCVRCSPSAEIYLGQGNAFLYLVKDKTGDYTIPKVLILNQDGEAREIRGVTENQNLGIYDQALEEKLTNIKHGNYVRIKLNSAKKLNEIDTKIKKGHSLGLEDLVFLYQEKVAGFGYGEDSRVGTIKNNIDLKSSLSKILNCDHDQIATSIDELNENTIALANERTEISDINKIKNLRLVLGSLIIQGVDPIQRENENKLVLENVSGDLALWDGNIELSKNINIEGGLSVVKPAEVTFPDKTRVKKTVHFVSDEIRELPNNLTVEDSLHIGKSSITKLSDSLKCPEVYGRKGQLTYIPPNFKGKIIP
ncbi:MAG: hypothetical protein HRT47_09115 [Candidatus Caenarcaniphilales bacterium]|nr:hypothetical protein [Candidatus Caenarcaniphilales bacterium]